MAASWITDRQTQYQAVAVIACGALAHELVYLRDQLGAQQTMKIRCLPANLHNRPDKIPALVEQEIIAHQSPRCKVFVAYADCGTGGKLDTVLQRYQVERLPGAHCYQFFTGLKAFERLAEQEPGTFYLTDFLLRHFERLVFKELGIDRHPELQSMYFGHYRRLVYLSQQEEPSLIEAARGCAERLGLAFEHRHTGYGLLGEGVRQQVELLWPH